MYLKTFVVFFFACITLGVVAIENGQTSGSGAQFLRIHPDFYERDHYVDQSLLRMFNDFYGHHHLLDKADRLQSLIHSPPYGSFRTLCHTMTMIRKDLFFYGSIVPDRMFLFYGTLGRTLKRASNTDGTKKQFTKFFDSASRRLDCIGYEADELMLRVHDYYNDAASDYGTLDQKYSVNERMSRMQAKIKYINEEPEVFFNGEGCETVDIKGYLLEKLAEIQREYQLLSDEASDEEIGRLFVKFRDISPVATTYFICVGIEDELAYEIDGEVIYMMREVLHLMMAKEAEKEKNLLTTIHKATFSLDQRRHKRYRIIHVPKTSTISCYGENKTLDEDARIIVRYCFEHCRRLIEEQQKNCKGADGSEANCQTCQVVVPKEELEGMEASIYTHFKEESAENVVFNFMAVDFDMMVPPLLTPNDIQTLLNFNIDFERDPAPDYYHHIEPMGKYRFPYEEPEELDWIPYMWLSLKTAICTTMAIWTLYFVNVYRFRFGRWLNRRWDQLYRRILGM